MRDLLVIGCASEDTLHLDQRGERQTHDTIGGAGLYTALAARRQGVDVTLFAPRPAAGKAIFASVDALINWVGPVASDEQMPRLEIAHHGGGKATLLNARWGAEALLAPHALPPEFASFKYIHIAALSSCERQLTFLDHVRRHSAAFVSAGTYAKLAYGETAEVRRLMEGVDAFFMNENEANALFAGQPRYPAAGKILFVTNGQHGATLYKDNQVSHIDADAAAEIDPTGAGDTFCGATLGAMIMGDSAFDAGHKAALLAARCIEIPGPAALLRQ